MMLLSNKFFNNLLFSKHYWLVRHSLFWMIMYTDEILAFIGLVEKEFDFKLFAFQISSDLILVYVSLYYLIPKFLTRKQLDKYILYTTLLVALAIVGNYFLIVNFLEGISDVVVGLFRSFLLTMGILGTAIAIKIIKKTLTNQQRLRELEKLTYQTEVNYLKMQTNPHFLFNTLNNIYVQSKKYPDAVPDSIMRLSDLMRYQIYDGSKQTATITDELKFVTDYLELEQLRKDHMKVSTEIDVDNPDLQISPLLFIPLVENAIKHSRCKEDNTICIKLYCQSHQGEVIFDIKNPAIPSYEKPPGIGLKNLKRRLELLYPDRHQLTISQNNVQYQVTLRLQT